MVRAEAELVANTMTHRRSITERFPATCIALGVIAFIFGVSGWVGFGIQLLGGTSDWTGWLYGLTGFLYFGVPVALVIDLLIGAS